MRGVDGTPARRAGMVMVGVAVAAAAVNLRPAITAISPVLSEVQRAEGMSSAEAGLLTTIPLLAFGACSLLAPMAGRRFGMEVSVMGALVALCAGIVVRSAPGIGPLFVGTAVLGVAIAIGNVLLPAIVKRDLGRHVALGTGIYSVALSGGAAVAAGVSVPLTHAVHSWRAGLAWWALPVVACALLWAWRLHDAHHDIAPVRVEHRMWRSPLAWQVTFFMGIQSLNFYATAAWIPTIFEQHGVAPSTAGWLLSVSGFVQLPTALVAPVLATTPRRERLAIVLTAATSVVALGGLLWDPVGGSWAWMTFLGLSQGAAIALALTFIVARAHGSAMAAELSGMAQAGGYLIASVGPFALGALREVTGGWTAPIVFLLGAVGAQLVFGLLVARGGMVGEQGVVGSTPSPAVEVAGP